MEKFKKFLTASSLLTAIYMTLGIVIKEYIPEPMLQKVMVTLTVVFTIGTVIILLAISAKGYMKAKREKEIEP